MKNIKIENNYNIKKVCKKKDIKFEICNVSNINIMGSNNKLSNNSNNSGNLIIIFNNNEKNKSHNIQINSKIDKNDIKKKVNNKDIKFINKLNIDAIEKFKDKLNLKVYDYKNGIKNNGIVNNNIDIGKLNINNVININIIKQNYLNNINKKIINNNNDEPKETKEKKNNRIENIIKNKIDDIKNKNNKEKNNSNFIKNNKNNDIFESNSSQFSRNLNNSQNTKTKINNETIDINRKINLDNKNNEKNELLSDLDIDKNPSYNNNDFVNEKNEEIKSVIQHKIERKRPVVALPSLQKRSLSQGKPFNLINKYYDENFILEDDEENIKLNEDSS